METQHRLGQQRTLPRESRGLLVSPRALVAVPQFLLLVLLPSTPSAFVIPESSFGGEVEVSTQQQIPRIIHQFWVGPAQGSQGDTSLTTVDVDVGGPQSPVLRAAMSAWRRAAHEAKPVVWQYRLWNRSSATALLASNSAHLLATFEKLARWPNRQKDFFAFFVLAELGGVFADADVVPLQPPSDWFRLLGNARNNRKKRASVLTAETRLLVGLEAAGSHEEARAWRWADRSQLAFWLVAAAPGHPALSRAIDKLTRAPPPPWQAGAGYMESIKLGPGLLTSEVVTWLGEVAGKRFKGLPNVCRRADGVRMGDTVVLGINGLGCGQPHSGSLPCNSTRAALVKHLFFGSWKSAPEDAVGAEDEDGPGRRRRRRILGEVIDWRLPVLALHAHLNVSGLHMPVEVVPLLFSRIVPTGPPMLAAPRDWPGAA
eukprot:TRINITY_DN56621_c0_g1_i1.p1 TRINITY_DN56621_c0_g1~~TRINITY_DN56621_c0_g1_i1.p1  ORF type:complete len:451 (+),score=63.10 TRINITY_DN56621_c0_g1_i1:68-1354(+)